MTTVRVCDMIMGSGKTQSAINLMCKDKNSKYIFITPYLNEVERIKQSCTDRKFVSPQNKGDGKLDNLHYLLAKGENIASTHALFRYYTDETLSLLRYHGYKLILDEVFNVVENLNIHKDDIEMLTDEKIIDVDEDGRVVRANNKYQGEFATLLETCDTGNVLLYGGKLMIWTFPVKVFEAFSDVIILTYLFDAQIQKYYFDINDVNIEYIGTKYERGEYSFCDYPALPDYAKHLSEKIHILNDERLNMVGDSRTALSVSWYERAAKAKGKPLIQMLKNNLYNLFRHKYQSNADENMWTTFKDYRPMLAGKGYTKGFLSYNIRATNNYRHKTHLAYCVNVYFNPYMKNYFTDLGVDVKEDEYALSEMIQWIWRSAIREDKEIWIYIPCKRMRTLLEEWLYKLTTN